MKIDEAKLTAYLLGEIHDPEQCRAIESALEADPELQRQADEIQALQDQLRAAFQKEHYVPSEFPGIPQTLPQLSRKDEDSSTIRWLPWVSGLAASFAVVCGFILLDLGEPSSPSMVDTSSGTQNGSVALEDFDLSLIRSELLGPGATWSDSQVLTNSRFYSEALEKMILPALTGSSVMDFGSTDVFEERAFSESFRDPLSEVPLYWDGFGMTRLELALGRGELPKPEEVEVEALVNAFAYDYDAPDSEEEAFAVHMEQAESPWQEGQTLLRVGLQGYDRSNDNLELNNFVFLIDVSGSMDEANKLPLIQEGLKYVAERMRPRDRMAIVTYGGSSFVHLPSTLGLDHERITTAINELASGVGSDEEGGILEAYRIATNSFMEDGRNRVIVCTDGDVQLGVRDSRQLDRTVMAGLQGGISLSVFGFSMVPGRHPGIEALATLGGGQFGFVDSPIDVTRSFAGRLTGEFATIASDVRLEVEFNPERVDAYRLIGYEENSGEVNRLAATRSEQLDVPSGHAVTALYELIPHEIQEDPKSRGAEIAALTNSQEEDVVEELVTVRVHYQPEGRTQEELIEVLFSEDASPFEKASDDMRCAAAVTGFGQILRNSPYKGDVDFNWVLSTAGGAIGENSGGTRTQFLEMVRQAETITNSDYSSAEN